MPRLGQFAASRPRRARRRDVADAELLLRQEDLAQRFNEEVADFGYVPRRCFWLVHDGYDMRPCAKPGQNQYGRELAFCHIHGKKFMFALLNEVGENPQFRDALIALVAQYDPEEIGLWTEHRKQIRRWPGESGRAHCVYFVERDGFVKIGRTSNLEKRIHDIGKGSCMPQGMSVGPVQLLAAIYCACDGKGCVRERHFHQKFRSQWLEGEWFLFDRVIASFIGGLEECLNDDLRNVSVPTETADAA
jgi:Meiotically up-regulated gene 113